MYVRRNISGLFHKAVKGFPAVLITGPRQSGKTTFLRNEMPDAHYVSFDDPLERAFAMRDPNGFLDRFGKGTVVFDEIQYVPDLFSYLKVRIDSDRGLCGRYLMIGSQQFQMMKHVSDSLAGRLAVLELLPFSFGEFPEGKSTDIQQMIWYGGYPSVLLQPEMRDLWFSSYLQTYLERDVRQLQNLRNLNLFEQYLGQCVARHGQLVNRASLAGAVGVSQPTVKEWETVLQASYVLYLLQPYYQNFGKRLTKSPKLYFIDSGLAAWLMRQPGSEALWRGASGGGFFEGWLILETVKCFASKRGRAPIYFWRSHDGVEVDMVIDFGGKLHGIEIKQTATPTMKHGDILQKWGAIIGEKNRGDMLVVCTCAEERPLGGGIRAVPWQGYLTWLDGLVS